MQAENIGWGEMVEIRFYKCITMVPMLITFFVILFLFTFYAYVSTSHFMTTLQFFLYPRIKGDYYGTLGVKDMWSSAEEL